MRRRTLLILALALLLVVPAVVAVAGTGFDTVESAAVIADQTQERARDCGECLDDATTPDRDQVRDRDQDRTNAPEDADRNQVQEQKQLRIHEPGSAQVGDQVRDQVRDREQVRDQTDCDGDGLQLREQVRTEAQHELKLAEPQGEQKGHGPGAQTGSGPPGDGTGSRFGRSDR